MVHLRNNGFKVDRKFLSPKDLQSFKEKQRVPSKLQSCHTAVIDGYIIEGHVPADLIEKLLAEKPAVLGLSVPGMPVGAPGMEGGKPERYEVLAFDKDGKTSVYARR